MRMRRRLTLALSLAALVGCGDHPDPMAAADDPASRNLSLAESGGVGCARRVNNTVEKLLECVTLDEVRAHQAALQAIADANGGTRVSGSPGYDLSADYVAGRLQAAGYDVTLQPFQFLAFVSLSPPLLEQVSPAPGPIATTIIDYSGSGDVTAPVTAVQNGGCSAADFAGFPAGDVALLDRGNCTFAVKATNAVGAGSRAVVVVNNAPGTVNGTLGSGFTLDIPVVGVGMVDGAQLAATPGLVLRVRTSTFRGIATSHNVLAESRTGDPDNVVMVGAHLDAVNAGPGINDNGSGVAAVLETALQMARVGTANRVRFAFWGAEESGLIGSRFYVEALDADALGRIAMYLNFDMIGSPNHGFFVYDGDDSDAFGAGPGPEGSAAIEALFVSFYAGRGLQTRGTDLSGRSDYGPFIAAGVPAGGISSGADGIKTANQAAMWGGTAGQRFDPCYHVACDTFANVNLSALDVNSDAVAFATLTSAMDGSMSLRGKRNPMPAGVAASAHVHGASDR